MINQRGVTLVFTAFYKIKLPSQYINYYYHNHTSFYPLEKGYTKKITTYHINIKSVINKYCDRLL